MYSSVCDVIVEKMQNIVGNARKSPVFFPRVVSFLSVLFDRDMIGQEEMVISLLLLQDIFKRLSSAETAALPALNIKTQGDDRDELFCVIAILLSYKMFVAPDENALDNKTFWAAYNTTLQPNHELYYDVDIKRSVQVEKLVQDACLKVFNACELSVLQLMDFTISVSPETFHATSKTIDELVNKTDELPCSSPHAHMPTSPPVMVPMVPRIIASPEGAINDDERWSAGSSLGRFGQGKMLLLHYGSSTISSSSRSVPSSFN